MECVVQLALAGVSAGGAAGCSPSARRPWTDSQFGVTGERIPLVVDSRGHSRTNHEQLCPDVLAGTTVK